MEVPVPDFQPLIDQVVVPIIGSVVTALVSVIAYRLQQWLHVTLTEKQGKVLEAAMMNGINFAISRATDYANSSGAAVLKHEVIDQAVQYVLPKVPKTLAKLGVTKEGLAQRIEARLPPAIPPPPSGT